MIIKVNLFRHSFIHQNLRIRRSLVKLSGLESVTKVMTGCLRTAKGGSSSFVELGGGVDDALV